MWVLPASVLIALTHLNSDRSSFYVSLAQTDSRGIDFSWALDTRGAGSLREGHR